MKRILAILSILAFLAGCEKTQPQGNDNNEGNGGTTSPTEENTTVRFDIQACNGVQNFNVGEIRTYNVDWYGIKRVQQSVPQGWSAQFSKETSTLTITAPATLSNAAEDGKIEFIAKGDGGEMFTPSIDVHLNGMIRLQIYGKGAEGTTSATALHLRHARNDADEEIEGCHELFLDVSPDVFNVVDSEGKNYVLNPDGTVSVGEGTSELPEGLCRLRINISTMKWELVKIHAVRYHQIGFDAMETPAEYLGRGCWLVRNAPLAALDGSYDLRYRFDVETSDPAALSHWCATWKTTTARPTTYELNYQYIRQIGSSSDNDGKGYWYFMDSDKGKWANITVCMNIEEGRSDYTHKISLKTFADTPVCGFMGDSITARWGRDNTGHPAFFSENAFLNAGISGQTTSQMLARFDADIVQFAPLAVVICAGTNDIAQNQGYISNEDITKNIAAMCEMATRAGIKVILCSLLPANKYNWRPSVQPAGLIKDMNIKIKDLCVQNGYTFVDFWTPFADSADGLPAVHSSDGVHPNQACYTLMENIIHPIILSVIDDQDEPQDPAAPESRESISENFTYGQSVDIL